MSETAAGLRLCGGWHRDQMGPGTVKLTDQEAQGESQNQMRCVYPPCGRSLTGRQKLYDPYRRDQE